MKNKIQKGPASFWYPYFATFPAPFDNVFAMSPEELEEIPQEYSLSSTNLFLFLFFVQSKKNYTFSFVGSLIRRKNRALMEQWETFDAFTEEHPEFWGTDPSYAPC